MAYTTIDDPSAYFQTVIWTGDGNDDRSITFDGNSDMQPDMVWTKRRPTASSHGLRDSTRGAVVELFPDDTAMDTSVADRFQAFESDGFQVGTNADINGTSNNTYVAWGWKGASSGISVSESGTSDDSLNACTHYANQDAGFSIVKFTGNNGSISNGEETRVTHGLGAVPEFIIIKSRDTAQSWVVQQDDNWNDYHLVLDTTAAGSGSLYTGNHASTTSAYFIVGNADLVNKADDEFIAYVWKGVQGYSKFGVYTGNDNANGPFIYLGFKPSFIMIKKTDTTGNWIIKDNKIDPDNPATQVIYANLSNAENAAQDIDLLSNGFKHRSAEGDGNDANDYIYMAFAESPFVTSSGVPATAR